MNDAPAIYVIKGGIRKTESFSVPSRKFTGEAKCRKTCAGMLKGSFGKVDSSKSFRIGHCQHLVIGPHPHAYFQNIFTVNFIEFRERKKIGL